MITGQEMNASVTSYRDSLIGKVNNYLEPLNSVNRAYQSIYKHLEILVQKGNIEDTPEIMKLSKKLWEIEESMNKIMKTSIEIVPYEEKEEDDMSY